MATVLSIVLSLFGLFLVYLLLGLRRVARDVRSVRFRPQNYLNNLVTSSGLSGLFFFLDPFSLVGYLTARVARRIPYLLAGSTWSLSRKYEGTST